MPRVREHATVLTFYAVLALAISWPLARGFATRLTGAGLDALSELWVVWHAVEAIAGREPFFSTTLLYYPVGASLLLHSAGPLSGVFALPFWRFGPVAGYNGALLVGLTLTGYAMYFLARRAGCSRLAAIFAGAVLLTAPAHLVGLRGHLAKVFLGLLPLALLTLDRALDLTRRAWWTAAFGATTLLILLHSPFQFVQIVLAAPVLVLGALIRSPARARLLTRVALCTLAATAAAGPLLVATARAAADPDILIGRASESVLHQPDLTQFLLPPSFGRLFGSFTTRTLDQWDVRPTIETEVAIPWTALVLAACGVALARTRAIGWTVLAAVGLTLSVGPTLRAFGAPVQLPGGAIVAMPYAWMTALPLFDFLRTPARFMQIAFVGLAVAAGLGLTAVTASPAGHGAGGAQDTHEPAGRRPGMRVPSIGREVLTMLALVTLLVEVWPVSWPTQTLPEPPGVYRELAKDPAMFGVLDLPVRPIPEVAALDYSARYQAYQLVHRKGIAGGYLSRTYSRHPISPCVYVTDRAPADVRVNGMPSRCEPAAIHQLAAHGYRYVVWHKRPAAAQDSAHGWWGDEEAESFVRAGFGGAAPVVDDGQSSVWAIPPPAQALPAQPVVEPGTGWHLAEAGWRWAASPAVLTITAARPQPAELTMRVALLPDGVERAGDSGPPLLVIDAGGTRTSAPLRVDSIIRVPILLRPGEQRVTFTSSAGSVRPSDAGAHDTRLLSFAVRWIDLVVR